MTEALRVALTFDAEHPDRPTEPGVAEDLVERLDRASVRATFFLQGRWVEAYPATARAIAAAGHRIGNHSHYHARMPLLTDAGIAEDIAAAGRAIVAASGVDPRPWFRAPFGAGATDLRIRQAIGTAGYRHAGWDVDALDWEIGRTAAEIEADIRSGVARRGDGAIILLHAWTIGAADALGPTIAALRDDGMTFVTIDELDDVPTAPSWA